MLLVLLVGLVVLVMKVVVLFGVYLLRGGMMKWLLVGLHLVMDMSKLALELLEVSRRLFPDFLFRRGPWHRRLDRFGELSGSVVG